MKLGLNVLFAGVIAAALLVPAATAKPGNGNGGGNGHGPPAWAGGGSGGAHANGKPAKANKGQEKKAEKAAQRDERRAARVAADEAPADAPKHDNPAWVCKFERERMGAVAFATHYGTNDNKSNAFGKCVSTEAHDRDGVTSGDDEAPEPVGEEPATAPDDVEQDSAAADALVALRALFRALTGLVF